MAGSSLDVFSLSKSLRSITHRSVLSIRALVLFMMGISNDEEEPSSSLSELAEGLPLYEDITKDDEAELSPPEDRYTPDQCRDHIVRTGCIEESGSTMPDEWRQNGSLVCIAMSGSQVVSESYADIIGLLSRYRTRAKLVSASIRVEIFSERSSTSNQSMRSLKHSMLTPLRRYTDDMFAE